jgi:hypothetical protein
MNCIFQSKNYCCLKDCKVDDECYCEFAEVCTEEYDGN